MTTSTKKASAQTEASEIHTNGNGQQNTFSVIPIASIVPSQLVPQIQRRAHFKAQDLTELADSIRTKGLISPITVRALKKAAGSTFNSAENKYESVELETGKFEIVAGERRWLASKEAGIPDIEAVIRNLSDDDALEVQLHENLKRVDIEPLDEALTYRYLIDEKGYTVQSIAEKFAKQPKLVHRRLKLADLCDEGKADLASHKLPLAHAELIARLPGKVQKQLLKNDVYNWDGRTNTEKHVADQIAYKYVLDLSGAVFDPKDPSLHKEGLTCGACTKRTGYTPALFEDDAKLAGKDFCLLKSCWNDKVIAWLKVRRLEFAQELPNPDELPIADLALQVPLVKELHGQMNVNIGKGDYVNLATYSSDKQFSEVEKGKECPYTEKGLVVYSHYSRKTLGTALLLCRSKDCKKHKLKEKIKSAGGARNDSDAYKENEFNGNILDKVRGLVIPDYVRTFNAKRSVVDSIEQQRKLLAAIFIRAGWSFDDDYPDEVLAFFPEKLLSNEDKKIVEAAEAMDQKQISQAFAAIAFGWLGKSESYGEAADVQPLRQISNSLGKDFDIIEAEIRVEEVPEAHKAAARDHLAKLRAGEASIPLPVYLKPKPPPVEKKKVAAKKKGAAA